MVKRASRGPAAQQSLLFPEQPPEEKPTRQRAPLIDEKDDPVCTGEYARFCEADREEAS